MIFYFANYQCFDFLGVAVKQHNIPEFTDILQYLDYLKLDEPIIGEKLDITLKKKKKIYLNLIVI